MIIGSLTSCRTSGMQAGRLGHRAVGLAAAAVMLLAVSAGAAADPQPGGMVHPNEPEGYTKITERFFAARDEDGWSSSGENFSIEEDPDAPDGSGRIGRMRFLTSLVPGRSPASAGRGFDGTSELYIHFWYKVSDNWYGHDRSNVSKMIYVTGRQIGGGGDPAYFATVGGGNNDLRFQVRLQNPAQGVPAGGRSNLGPNVGRADIVRGQWHQIEVILRMNSGDEADGECHVWFDGVKSHEYTDVKYSSAEQGKTFDNHRWLPVYGGVAGSNPPEEQYQYISYWYSSGR